jgi:hypothetical protein
MGRIAASDLASLPFETLSLLALAAARDIDGGAEDKRALLERIMRVIAMNRGWQTSKGWL